MEPDEILRFLAGMRKKHGDNFALSLKYETETGKVRKRSGVFQELIDDKTLVLHNRKKKSIGRYSIDLIRNIEKNSEI